MIHYETGSVSSHARSLWRLEILRVVYVDTVGFIYGIVAEIYSSLISKIL